MVDLEVKLSKNATTVLEKRYLKKDEKEQVCERPDVGKMAGIPRLRRRK